MTILWIENESVYSEPQLQYLRESGYIVDLEVSAEAAITKLRDNSEIYDLILLDILMGEKPIEGKAVKNGRTGLVVYDIIRNDLKLGIPIIFITVVDNIDIKTINKIKQTEISFGQSYRVLHKPLRPSELLKAVKKIVTIH